MLSRFLVPLLVLVVGSTPGCRPSTIAPVVEPPSRITRQIASGAVRRPPEKIDARQLPNAYRVHEKVISGGQPDGEAAFGELQSLGVRTIISVDGARPQVEMARRYGLRYVHLPHGYDGIPDQHARLLAKAVQELPGPIYVHCHHGKHRSPAAAAVGCVGAGLLPPDAALAILRTAGTSESYRGLYQSAAAARPVDDHLLRSLTADFCEAVELPPLAQSMVVIEQTCDHLRLMSKGGWRAPADHPDLVANHEALLLREHFTELLRLPEAERQSDAFKQLLGDSVEAARALEAALQSELGRSDARFAAADAALERIDQQCATCHRRFRDVPLSEKPTR